MQELAVGRIEEAADGGSELTSGTEGLSDSENAAEASIRNSAKLLSDSEAVGPSEVMEFLPWMLGVSSSYSLDVLKVLSGTTVTINYPKIGPPPTAERPLIHPSHSFPLRDQY